MLWKKVVKKSYTTQSGCDLELISKGGREHWQRAHHLILVLVTWPSREFIHELVLVTSAAREAVDKYDEKDKKKQEHYRFTHYLVSTSFLILILEDEVY